MRQRTFNEKKVVSAENNPFENDANFGLPELTIFMLCLTKTGFRITVAFGPGSETFQLPISEDLFDLIPNDYDFCYSLADIEAMNLSAKIFVAVYCQR